MDKVDYRIKDFGKLLKKNALANRRELGSRDTNCMRVYDRNIDVIPVTVDVYGNYVRITDFGESPVDDEMLSKLRQSCASYLYKEPEKVVFQRRSKREGLEQHIQNGESTPVTVTESGLRFDCDLTKHIDTGLFLDNVLARRYIRDISEGKDVLNLFCYTGAYSVYAAAGGAKSVTSVDLSSTYLDVAKKNMETNSFTGPQFRFINADVQEYITHPTQERFDLIIYDGPSFSNSNKMEKDYRVDRDWRKCLDALYLLTRENGIVLFQSNLGSFRLDIRPEDGWKATEITRDVTAPGFTQKTGRNRSWILEKRERTFTKRDSGKTARVSHTSYRDGEKRFASSDRPRYGKPGSDYRPRHDDYRDGERNYRNHRDGSYGTGRSYSDYSDRPFRSERSYNSDRDDRGYKDRESYSRDGERRFERPRHDTHERYHSERRSRSDYSDRPSRTERESYPRDGERDRRPYIQKDHRQGYASSSGDRNNAPYRKPKSKGPKPYGFDKFSETKDRSDSNSEGTFFWLDED